MRSRTIKAYIGEGDLARPLKEIQDRYPEVIVGSYPFEEQGRYGSHLVLRSRNPEMLDKSARETEEMAEALKISGTVKVWS